MLSLNRPINFRGLLSTGLFGGGDAFYQYLSVHLWNYINSLDSGYPLLLSLSPRQLCIRIALSGVVLQVNLTFSKKPNFELSLHVRINFPNHLDDIWHILPYSVVLCVHVLFLLKDRDHLPEP